LSPDDDAIRRATITGILREMAEIPPVLLIAFNRVETLRSVIDALAPLAPPRVFAAADGPRAGREGERTRCDEVRALLTNLPWKCELRTRFLDANVGCALGVRGAISWFFNEVPAGIVLEDDCVPDATFLPFCAEMLERHADDARVMSVLGTRFAPELPTQRASYTFTRFSSVWGWASWRRAWARHELALGDWRAKCKTQGVPLPALSPASNAGWARKLDRVSRDGTPGTWDYQWSFAHFRHEGLAVLPRSNLISNIGAGPGATHLGRGSIWLEMPQTPLAFPLVHPDRVEPDELADWHHETWHLNHRPWLLRKWWQFRNRHEVGSIDVRRGVRSFHRAAKAL
jgi:hypothetical protein